MYIPDISSASESLPVSDDKVVLIFPVYSIKFCPETDPYLPVLKELAVEGINRNVYMVNKNRKPVWRVQDHGNSSTDGFIKIDAKDKDSGYIIGQTFN